MVSTDLIIIGAGPGGYRAAEYAAKQGLKVVIIEQGEVGGTCLNVGCIPTKTYVHAATFDEARSRMAQVVPQLRAGVEGILSHPNLTLIRSHAQFADAHTLHLGSDSIAAKHIIIATGSSPKLLPLPDINDPRLVDSTGLLNLDTLPKKLCIIGAGVIGMEFASVFHRFGSEVTVIEFLKECLPMLDSDIAKRLRKVLEKRGVEFNLQCGVTGIERSEDSTETKVVTFQDKKGREQRVEAEAVLMAVGRAPRVFDHFKSAGFEYDERRGITVDDNFQTTVPGIYAIGDVNGRQMLAHAAEWQAKVVIDRLTDTSKSPINESTEAHPRASDGAWPVPAAIFTNPEAACVGKTEDQLKAEGAAYECRKAFHRANGKALAMNETEGMLKLLSEPGAGRILGCHAFGAHSTDLIQEASALMCRNTTVEQLRHMVHIHPTLSEILLAAAEA